MKSFFHIYQRAIKLDWDEELPSSIQGKHREWKEQFSLIKNIFVTWFYFSPESTVLMTELHRFLMLLKMLRQSLFIFKYFMTKDLTLLLWLLLKQRLLHSTVDTKTSALWCTSITIGKTNDQEAKVSRWKCIHWVFLASLASSPMKTAFPCTIFIGRAILIPH